MLLETRYVTFSGTAIPLISHQMVLCQIRLLGVIGKEHFSHFLFLGNLAQYKYNNKNIGINL